MDSSVFLVIAVTAAIGCAGIGAYLSREKGRSPVEGGLFGLFLGPLGLLIAVLLPTVDRPLVSSRTSVYEEDDNLPVAVPFVEQLAAEARSTAVNLGIVAADEPRARSDYWEGPGLTADDLERRAGDEAIRRIAGEG